MDLQYKPFIHLFKTRNECYCYDVNTSSVIRVNDRTYVDLQSNKNAFESDGVRKLHEKGYLSPKNDDIIIEHSATPDVEVYLQDGVQQLILQLTQNCNLRCKYCIYSGSYQNRVHQNKRMTFETAQKAIDFYYNHSRATDMIRIGLYGGEPLLEMALIKEITVYCENLFRGKELRINMTTNATLLNEEIIDFLQSHNFDLMISLDGPEFVHDKGRVFADNNSGTFQVIMQKLEIIRQKHPDYLDKISFNAVTGYENDFIGSSHFFTYDFMGNATIMSTGVSDRDAIGDVVLQNSFYINYSYELFKSFIAYVGELDHNHISKLIASHKGLLMNSVHERISTPYRRKGKCHPNGPCIAGVNRLFVTVDGDFYPCERVSETNDSFRIGCLADGFYLEKVVKLLNTGKLTEDECKNCWAINLCSLCAADFGEGTELSVEKKQQKCAVARKEAEGHLKEYCTLREYGCYFEK